MLFCFSRFHIILHKVLLSSVDKAMQAAILYGNYTISVLFLKQIGTRHTALKPLILSELFFYTSRASIKDQEYTSTGMSGKTKNYPLFSKSYKTERAAPDVDKSLYHTFFHSSMKFHLPDCCIALMSYFNN